MIMQIAIHLLGERQEYIIFVLDSAKTEFTVKYLPGNPNLLFEIKFKVRYVNNCIQYNIVDNEINDITKWDTMRKLSIDDQFQLPHYVPNYNMNVSAQLLSLCGPEARLREVVRGHISQYHYDNENRP